jgi:hypothetical protein
MPLTTPPPWRRWLGDSNTYTYLATSIAACVRRHLVHNIRPYVKRYVFGVHAPTWLPGERVKYGVAKSLVAAIMGQRKPRASKGGGTFEQLPDDAKTVVHTVWQLLGFNVASGERTPALDKEWQRSKAKLPCIMRLYFFLAQEISDKSCNAANIQLLPVMSRRMLHIRLDSEAMWGILREAQRALPLTPMPPQPPRKTRRRRKGLKGRGKRRRGHRRYLGYVPPAGERCHRDSPHGSRNSCGKAYSPIAPARSSWSLLCSARLG